MSSHQTRKERRAAQRLNSQPVSVARVEANRANAQLSTGPRTVEGKAVSSLNAVKTGLTGRTVVLPSDDAPAYQAQVASFFARYQPCGDREQELVQSLADTQWRLNRIPSLEAGIYALGRIECGSQFDEHDEALRPALIDAQVFLTYQKQLRNLSTQESRLRRQYQNDLQELTELQAQRQSAASQLTQFRSPHPQPNQPDLGFEFSSADANPHPAAAMHVDLPSCPAALAGAPGLLSSPAL